MLDNSIIDGEVQLPERLIKEYQDLNEKLEQTISKIKKRKTPKK